MRNLLIKLSGLAGLAIFAVPIHAGATADRIVAQFPNSSLYMKDGSAKSSWLPIADPSSAASNVSVSGARVAFIDNNDPFMPVYIKEPSWDSQWHKVFTGDTNAYAYAEKTCQLSNGQYRLLVAYYDGSQDKLIMKDGSYNAGWWTLDMAGGDPWDTTCAADRVGAVLSTGTFVAKVLTPGQFTDPNSVGWQTVATNVTSVAMTANRLAYVDGNFKVYAKEGALNAPWFGNQAIIYDNSVDFRLGGNRLCVLKSNNVECKEGSLGAPSKLTWGGAWDFDLSSSRVVVDANDPSAVDSTSTWVLEGSINGANSGWQKISGDGVQNIHLNNWAY